MDRILGQSLTGVVWIAGATVAFGLGAFLWYRTTVEPSPGFPLQYAPPPGLGPVQTEYIRTETVPKNGLTATLFYLAERKLIDLQQVNDKQWNIRGTAEPGAWADVDPVSVAVGSALKVMNAGAEFEAKHTAKSGQKLNKAKTDMAVAVAKWSLDNGLMVKVKKELWVRTANAIAFILMVCGFFRWGFPTTIWALPFAAFFLLVDPVVGRRRRQPTHRFRARIVVARRGIPSHADHRFGRDPLRLRCTQGSLHRLCPVRGRGRRRRPMGEEV